MNRNFPLGYARKMSPGEERQEQTAEDRRQERDANAAPVSNRPEYLKVHSGTRKVFVQVIRRIGDRIIGRRVLRNGANWERETADAIQIEVVVFRAADVIGRYRMNLHYGELEPVS